jgi:hypothetical protein
MAIKKRKDISQEVAKLEDEGQDASQKAVDLAKFAEATKSTFESLSPDFTEETSQTISQASHELQASIDTNHSEVLQESENVLANLEQKQKGFEGAITADKSDISKLNTLQAEGNEVAHSNIAKVQESKQEEIDFLTGLIKDVEEVQDDIDKKLNESKQRRQAARFSYKSKSLDNNQAGSSESGGDSHTKVETPLDSQVEENQNSPEEATKEKAKKGGADKAAKVANDQVINNFNLKGGHGHACHGYQTTREEQQIRLLTGRTPDGHLRRPPPKASRFFDTQSEALAIKKAEAVLGQLPMPGQAIPQSLGRQDARGYVTVIVRADPELASFGESGRILTRNPDTFEWVDKDEATFVFKPNNNYTDWELVTYFP